MVEEKQITNRKKHEDNLFSLSGDRYQQGLEMAEMLCKSDLVPAAYKGNIPNTMIALSMASRLEMDPMTVMQNLHIIKGKPSWSSSFIIACINSCGRFTPLNFLFEGKEKTEDFGCRAIAKDLKTGNELRGTLVTWKMVKAEGWYSKKDRHGKETSKWQTMGELMFQYRAAAFFGRVFCPDLLHGMHSNEEVIDITHREVEKTPENRQEQEQERIKRWIEEAKTIEDLAMLQDSEMSSENQKLFISKEQALKEKKDGEK